jgi:hypothetical protein
MSETQPQSNGEYKDIKLNIRTKLIGLWTVLMLLYIYCDIHTLFRPGQINAVINGFMGQFPINQISLLVTGVVLAIPALMIIANLFIKMSTIRWINIIAGIVYMFVNIGNMTGEKWAYNIFYGIIELAITITIVIMSIKWRKKI